MIRFPQERRSADRRGGTGAQHPQAGVHEPAVVFGGPAGVGVAVGRAVRTSLIAVMLIDLLVGLAVYGGPSGAVKVSG